MYKVVQIWPGQTVTFYTQIVPVIFEPPCTFPDTDELQGNSRSWILLLVRLIKHVHIESFILQRDFGVLVTPCVVENRVKCTAKSQKKKLDPPSKLIFSNAPLKSPDSQHACDISPCIYSVYIFVNRAVANLLQETPRNSKNKFIFICFRNVYPQE
jgi:hypothetical protein